MSSQLQRAINIAKKTGDKLIVFDSREPENSYVLIPFAQYEREVYEGGNFAKMDKDYKDDDNFSLVENDDENGYFGNNYKVENDFTDISKDYLTEEDRIDKINRDLLISEEDDTLNDNGFYGMDFLDNDDVKNKKGHWSIPKNIKEVAEEVVDEDRHYLEEITF